MIELKRLERYFERKDFQSYVKKFHDYQALLKKYRRNDKMLAG